MLIVALAFGFRLWLLHAFVPGAPWVANLTLADAEMGRNLLAGRGWVANQDLVDRAVHAQEGRPLMVDLQDLLPADDAKPGVMVTPGSAHSPGYSIWFAVSYWLGGDIRYVYSQIMQGALDAGACFLLFAIGRRVWSTGAGLAAALWYAVSPAHAFLANLTVAASTDSFWFIAVAYGAVRAWCVLAEGRRPWMETGFIAAAAFGGAAMNSTSFVLPLVVAGFALAAAILDRRALRLVPYFVAAQLLVVLALAPWALRNNRLFGQLSPVRGSFWQLAYASWGELPNPWGLGFDDKYYWNWIQENCPGCDPGQQVVAIRTYIQREVLPSPGFMRHVARLVTLRLPRLLTVAQMEPGFEGSPASGAMRGALRWWIRASDALVPIVALAIVAGLLLVIFRQGRAGPAALALAPSVFLICFSLVFYVELRKTVPAYGVLFVLAGIAAVEAGQRLAALRRRHAVAVLVAVSAALGPRLSAAVISAGQMHAVVVKPDTTVWSWGTAVLGQLGDGESNRTLDDNTQAKNLFDVTAVAAGGNHSLALTKDGSVWAWGDNFWGELGDGTHTSRRAPVRVAGLERVVAIAAGYLHSIALDADGVVWAWGDNHYGQLGTGTTAEHLTPVRVHALPNTTAIAAGFFHSMSIDRAGHAWSWGQNTRGQLGRGSAQMETRPAEIPAVVDAIAIVGGQLHSLALRSDGRVWSWGGNVFGQLGQNLTPDVVSPPAIIPGLAGMTMVSAGEDHSVALGGDGRVWAWGDNLYGQLGDGTWEVRRAPVETRALPPVVAIASGHAHVLALAANGTLFTWGFGYDGQLGDNLTTRRVSTPHRVAAFSLAPGPDFDAPSFHPISRAEASFAAPIVTFQNGVFKVKGKAESETAYVISSTAVKAGPREDLRTLAATGRVIDGCVTVGVQQRGQWVFYRNFNRPGPFSLEWQPPAGGDYMIVLAHCLPSGRRDNNFEVTHLGWLDARAAGAAKP